MHATSLVPTVGIGIAAGARVLLIERRPGSLGHLGQGLAMQGLSYAAAHGFSQASEKLQFDSRIALCVTDSTDDERGRTELLYRYPGLQWVVSAARTRSSIVLGPRDVIAGPAPEQLFEATLLALRAHPYDQGILDALDAALRIQWATFGPASGAHFIRRDARSLEAVTAMVEVGGQGVWGRLVFSASEKVLFREARRVHSSVPSSLDMVTDMASESANRLASDVRRYYRAHGLTSTQGAPVTVAGQGVRITPICDTASLVVEHRASTGDRVFCEWHMGLRPTLSERVAYGTLPTGDPVFL